MTFHAPQTTARLISMVARRVLFCRASVVTATAIVSTTVVLAGRAGDRLEDHPVVVANVDFMTFESGLHRNLGDKRALPARTADAIPDTLARPSQVDRALTSADLDDKVATVRTDSPAYLKIEGLRDARPRQPSVLGSGLKPDSPDAHPVQVASLAPPNYDWGTLESVLTPRLPELGPVPVAPPAAARTGDTAPEIDGLESGPAILTLTAKPEEALDDLLRRGDMSAEDHRATIVALRADEVAESLIEGDMIDLAFLADDDRQLLALRLRQLGKPPIELRWDSRTVPLWGEIDDSMAVLEPAKPAPNTLSVTGKQDDTTFVSGQINSSLYASASKAGLSARETKALSNIFRYSVDFERDLRKGDRFEALFEKGENGSFGNILYAKLTNRGSEIALYRGEDDVTGEVGYFDATGKTNKRSLMRTPVAGARVSSHFGMRHHPILGYNKMHRGTDFRAPRGTPIFAAGDGIVDYAGRKGAYGKYIRIRHNGVYETAYAHLSRYAPGLTSGRRVRQGEVIGYVGTTGRSTGPHLHFEILQHGNQINPLNIADFGPTRGLSGAGLSAFMVRVSRIEIALTLMRNGSRIASSD